MTVPISLADWRAAGDDALRHRGQRVFARTGGASDAPALLLIHGFPTASWDFAFVWPGLAQSHRLLAPDLIGFGFSAKPRAYDYSIVDQADLCEGLLREHGVRAYRVLAHDYGDSVAQELLARRIDGGDRPRLDGVTFLNGGLFPEAHRALATQKLLRSPLGPLVARLVSRRSFDATMRRIFGAGTPPGRELLDGHWELVSRDGGRAIMPQLIRYLDERRARRERWVGALQRAPVPVAFACGLADPISGAHMLARWRELVPHGRACPLPGLGHYPQCQAPGAVLAALERQGPT